MRKLDPQLKWVALGYHWRILVENLWLILTSVTNIPIIKLSPPSGNTYFAELSTKMGRTTRGSYFCSF